MNEDSPFLSLKEINKEISDFYERDVDDIIRFKDIQRESFLKIHADIVSTHIIKALQPIERNISFPEMNTNIAILCIGVEKLLALCLMQKDWIGFWTEYQKNKRKIAFSFLKKRVLSDVKEEYSEEQYERLSDILDHFFLQRNNFIHSNPRGTTHYVTEDTQIILILVLAHHYKIPLTKKAISEMFKILEHPFGRSGLQLRDVGFFEQRDLFREELEAIGEKR